MVYLLQWFMIGLSLSKDLYLVITLKLILCFSWKAPALFMKSTYTFCEKLLKTTKTADSTQNLSFWLGLSQSTEGRPTRYILIFGGVWSEKWMKSIWKAYESIMKMKDHLQGIVTPCVLFFWNKYWFANRAQFDPYPVNEHYPFSLCMFCQWAMSPFFTFSTFFFFVYFLFRTGILKKCLSL